MLFRFCLKVSALGYNRCHYIKAKNASSAFKKFTDSHREMNITKIEVVGDPLPAPEKTIKQLIKEAKTNSAKKRKRWVAAKKYELKAGISVFAKPKI